MLVPTLGNAEESVPGPAAALERLSLSGSLRGSYWSSSRDLDDRSHIATAALWLKAAPKLPGDVSLFAEGWLRGDDVLGDGESRGLLREAYVRRAFGLIDVSAGRQIVAWGRADRINPTDNLTPRDFTLLVPEDEDQRFGAVVVRAGYFSGGTSLNAFWLPHFEPHVIPFPQPPPGVELRERVPHETFGQWALKFERTGGAVDWSLSYFDGFDLFPDLGVDRAGPAGVDLLLRHHRIRVIGADAATNLGPYALRGEVAYTFTENPHGRRFDVKRPFLFLVAGGDRTFREHLNVNVQYLFKAIAHFRAPQQLADPVQRGAALEQAVLNNQLDEFEHGVTLRVSYRWLQETLETEIAVVSWLNRLDYAVRPRIVYAVTDRARATVGVDVFGGPRRSVFGRLEDNTTAYAELRFSF